MRIKFLVFFALLCLSVSSAWALTPAGGDIWDDVTKTLTVNSDPEEKSYSDETEIQHLVIAASVTYIGDEAFQSCDNLATVTFVEGSLLESIGDLAFEGCVNLTSITIPANVTSIGMGAFDACENLTSVTFADGSLLTSISDCAFSNSGLTSITIPANVTSISETAFEGCFSMTAINVTDGNTNFASDDDVLFNKDKSTLIQCPRGKSGTISTLPSSVTTIGNNAFEWCSQITDITIPASVASIGTNAFYHCSGLTSITIPNSVTSIGNFVFADCANLTMVTINGNPHIGSGSFPVATTVKMNLTAKGTGDNAYWMTFYNQNYGFTADANTQVFTASLTNDGLDLHPMDGGVIPANNPVILKSASAAIELTKNNATGTLGDNVLKGTTTTLNGNGKIYVLSNGQDKNSNIGFYKLSTTGILDVNKAYLEYGSGAREFICFGEGNTTGIEMTTAEDNNTDTFVYDLQGRHVTQPTKGLYIVNGKKIVIK